MSLEKIGKADFDQADAELRAAGVKRKKIRFSHLYPKLLMANGKPPRSAVLLEVLQVKLQQLADHFLRYDTDNFKYQLPRSGDYMMLIFRKEETNEIFTTMRPAFPQEKVHYYRHARGEVFDVEFVGPTGK